MLNEFPYSLQVVFRIFFDIIVACKLYEIWFESLIYGIFPQTVAMTYMNYFVSLTMNNVNRTIKLLYPIYIGELING